MTEDRQQYLKKKQFFQQLLTIYGRKPVLEALQNPQVRIYKLHLADSNRRDGIVNEIVDAAEREGIEVAWHERRALSRISKNGKQDQGVAADLQLKAYRPCSNIPASSHTTIRRIQIPTDRVHTPQNPGLNIRPVAVMGIEHPPLPQKATSGLMERNSGFKKRTGRRTGRGVNLGRKPVSF